MTSRAAPLVVAVLAGFLLAVAALGLAFGLGRRYESALANPTAFEHLLREAWDSGIALGRRVDSVTTDFAAFKRKACEPRVRLVEVPLWTPPSR